MNSIAKELNDSLKGTIISDLLSELGKEMFFPKGIVAQSAEAAQKANKINATVGMAYENKKPLVLPLVNELLPGLDNVEIAAYAPTAGLASLRKVWKEQILKKNPLVKAENITDPVVVSGLTSGIFQMAELFVNPGDTVIVPDMFWGNYRLILASRRKANIQEFSFFTDNGGLNLDALRTTMDQVTASSNKAILLLNFPNNPTGYTPSTSEVEAIKEMLLQYAKKGKKILVATDDAYFGLFYDDSCYKHSLFQEIYDLHENILALKVDGSTKEDYVWGFRVGFMTFGSKGLTKNHHAALIKKLMGSIRSTVSNSPGLSQHLLIRILNDPSYADQKKKVAEDLQLRYEKVKEILPQIEELSGNRLQALPFNSGYFMSFICQGISAEKLRLELLDRGFGTISINDNYLRVAYASIDQEDLESVFKEIGACAKNL